MTANGKTVLLVEDNEDNRIVYSTILRHFGYTATQVLKHDPQTRSIPIIALTAHALASDREKAMEVGCDGYLAKPCEPRAVVAEVQRFLGKIDGSTS